jgi:antitoxin component YwqK of YwqJK toxin-antitoxin module
MVENLITSKSHTALNSHSLYLSSSNAMLIFMVLIFVLFNSFAVDKTLKEKKYFDGDIASKVFIQDGLKDGIEKRYTKKGVLKYIAVYKDGKRHGTQKWFDRNGKLLSQTNYFNDKPHGIEKVFYENGTVMIERHYVHGKKHGFEKRFREDAMIVSIVSYNNGTLEQS